MTFNNVKIDNSAGDAGGKGHNTDGFDVGSSTNVHIAGAWVHTQDDCLAINSGSDIAFAGSPYAGLIHGLSISNVDGRAHNDVPSGMAMASETACTCAAINVLNYDEERMRDIPGCSQANKGRAWSRGH